jgi:hypothetical protein
VPVTVNCRVPPMASETEAGDTAMEESVGVPPLLTVTADVAVLLDAVCVAVTVAVPTATAVTSPAALTVATPVEEETKVEPAVRLAVEESLNVPVTVNCCVAPGASVGLAGVTAMETRVGATLPPTTNTVAVAIRPEAVCVATMVVLPAETPVTSPLALTVATPGEEDTKVEPAVTLKVEKSL